MDEKIKIPVFFSKDRFDSFLAAHCITTVLVKQRPAMGFIGLGKGDHLPDLKGKYPIFVDVDFNDLKSLENIKGAMNLSATLRTAQFEGVMSVADLFPGDTKFQFFGRGSATNAVWQRYYRNEKDPNRINEVMPAFIKWYINLVEKPPENPMKQQYTLAGFEEDAYFRESDPYRFDKFIVKEWQNNQALIIREHMMAGSAAVKMEQEYVARWLKRTTVTTNFLGHTVKLASVPEELAQKAGAILAEGMPFSVIIEDRFAEGERIYHLTSKEGQVDVLALTKKYGAKGTARYATFVGKMDFTNFQWI